MATRIEDMLMDDFTLNPEDNIFGIDQINIDTNVKDQVTQALMASLKAGKLNAKEFQTINERLQLNINFNFDNDYGLNFSTNDYMGDTPVDYKMGITKEF